MKTLIKWLRIIHRDAGYLAVGLTVIFSVSGIAVNHVQDWNPNYSIKKIPFHISPVYGNNKEEILTRILPQLGLTKKDIRNSFRPNPGEIQIFTESGTFQFNINTGMGFKEQISKRSMLYDFNFLHLNSGKDSWKWFSDLFALILIFLAISGLFMVRGRKGFKWRGLILMILGLILPIFFIAYYRFF